MSEEYSACLKCNYATAYTSIQSALVLHSVTAGRDAVTEAWGEGTYGQHMRRLLAHEIKYLNTRPDHISLDAAVDFFVNAATKEFGESVRAAEVIMRAKAAAYAIQTDG
jgi:hypothetical protein